MEHIYLTYEVTDECRQMAATQRINQIRSEIWNAPESVEALDNCSSDLRAELFASFGFFLGEN
jgi:hypothetical protein